MIKDVVVNLGLTTDRDAVAKFAISIAEAFQAHIAGIAFAYEPVVTPTVVDGLSAAWMDTQRNKTWPPLERPSSVSKRPPDAKARPLGTGCLKQALAPPPRCSAASLGVSICRWSARRSLMGW